MTDKHIGPPTITVNGRNLEISSKISNPDEITNKQPSELENKRQDDDNVIADWVPSEKGRKFDIKPINRKNGVEPGSKKDIKIDYERESPPENTFNKKKGPNY